jgi:hypothetical protein
MGGACSSHAEGERRVQGFGGKSHAPVTRHNTPIHNILSTAPQFSISQKALGKLPEDGNVMPKHVGPTIHNKLNE